MNSEQETIVAAFMANSMGAPFLFAPDNQKKESGKEVEPADLAWVFEGTAILINMYGGAKEAADRHNFSTLRTWLHRWRHHYDLTGRNPVQEFRVRYADIQRIVLVSVGRGTNTDARFESEWCKIISAIHPKVLACVSLHESVFGLLSRYGASALDLLSWIDFLRLNREMIFSENEMLQEIGNAYGAVHLGLPLVQHYLNYVRKVLLSLRTAAHLDASKIFNDIPLEVVEEICWHVADYAAQVATVPLGGFGPSSRIATTQFGPYIFCTTVSRLGQNAQQVTSQANERANAIHTATGRMPVYLYFLLMDQELSVMTATYDESVRRVCTEIIEGWSAD